MATKIKYKPTRAKIRQIVNLHTKMKSSFFWRPPPNASGRRSYEKSHSNSISFTHEKKKYVIRQSTECSAKNIYYSLNISVNGMKKDIRALKSII